MPPPDARPESGQASLALVATVPLLVAAAVLLVHLALVGAAAWSAADSSRAAARAAYVGAAPERAAQRASFAPLADRPRARVRHGLARVRVRVRGPAALGRLVPTLLLRSRSRLAPSGGRADR